MLNKTKPGSLSRRIRFRIKRMESTLWDLRTRFRKPRYEPKVFCIGFYKTGTTSLGAALKELGYAHSSFHKKIGVDFYETKQFDKIIDYTARYDSFDDTPWFQEDIIPLLDSKFPRSKFIYLERNEKDWLQSFKNWSEKMTGDKNPKDEWLEQFRAHRKFVLDYFTNRAASEFISLDISDPDGFQKLCRYLGKESSRKSFPHLNKT